MPYPRDQAIAISHELGLGGEIHSVGGGKFNPGRTPDEYRATKTEKQESYRPTEEMASAARRGLKMREGQPPSNRGGTEVGLARARQLVNRQSLSLDTVKRMYSFFSRHEVDKKSESWKKGNSKGEQAWLLWGGDPGYRWSRRIVESEARKTYNTENPLIKSDEMNNTVEVAKIDNDLGLVFGWGMICTKNGEEYFDTDNQHFPESVTLKGWSDFMQKARVHKAMHAGEQVGEVVFAFPMMSDIAKSLGIETPNQTGVIVGVKPDASTLKRFQSGELKAFSFGGAARMEDLD